MTRAPIPEIKIGPSAEPGFFPLKAAQPCRHPEHRMPMHLHIPEGYGYRHVCPACGAESTAYGADYRFDAA